MADQMTRSCESQDTTADPVAERLPEAQGLTNGECWRTVLVIVLAGFCGVGCQSFLGAVFGSQGALPKVFLGMFPYQILPIGGLVVGLWKPMKRLGWKRCLEWERRQESWWALLMRSVFLTGRLVSVMLVCVFICKSIVEQFGVSFPEQELVKIIRQKGDFGAVGLVFLSSIVLAPLVEECAFRHLLYKALRSQVGTGMAMTVSSAFFACLHGHYPLIPPLFVFGLFQQIVYTEYGLCQVVLVHALYNALQLALVVIR